MKKIHTPNPGSVAARLIIFFESNPEELLTVDDIARKFDCNRNSVHTLLAPAMQDLFFTRKRSEYGEYTYHAGPLITKEAPAPVHLSAAMGSIIPPHLLREGQPEPVGTVESVTATADGPVVKVKMAPKRAPAPQAGHSRKMLDMDAIQVETGHPYTPEARKGESKWDALFKKLTEKGQSVAIPGEFKPAVTAAAAKYNKRHPGKYRAAMTSKTEARVWRLE